MDGLRDYVAWHNAYDDPGSDLSWRLARVQEYLAEAFEHHAGAMKVLSLCSGDGRDVLGVLARRRDADRVEVTLVELHPELAHRARDSAVAAGLSNVEVRKGDAGTTSSYADAAPADIVVMVGVFGNISDADLERTVRATPQLCRTGATLIWSRGRARGDRNDAVRRWFIECGFVELGYTEREGRSRPSLGVVRYEGDPQALVPGRQLFTFLR